MAKHPCYDENALKQFLTGKLPDQEAPQVEQHLLECDRCADTVNGLASSDTLADAMKKTDESGDSQLTGTDSLAQRLIALRKQSDSPDAETIDPSDSPRPTDDLTLAITDLLSPAQSDDELGRLGDYRILKVLGSGGMGVVFQAEDIYLKRNVALKVMKREIAANPTSRERFMREAQATAALDHDNIVTIFRVGEENNMPYLAMQMLAGSSLKDRLTRGKALPLKAILRLGKQIAEGLAVAHEAGLIHRDIKPANIWIEPVAGGRAKILDFGLARSVKSDASVTQSGQILGTPAYMSPEQASGKTVDERCDLFSLGCVLYQLSTGELPFRGGDTMAVLMALATEDPTPPKDVNPNIPVELSDFVMKLLAKNADDRVSSAKEVLATLRKIEKALDITTSLQPVAKPSVGARSPDLAPAPTAGLPKPQKAARRTSPEKAKHEMRPLGSGPAHALPDGRGSSKKRLLFAAAILLAVLGPLTFFFGGTVFRFVTNQGTLIIDVKDPNIQVLVKQGGLQVEDKTSKRMFTLKAEKGQIEVFEKDGVGPLLTKTFSLNRGGKTTVVVTLQELKTARTPRQINRPSGSEFALYLNGPQVEVPSLSLNTKAPLTMECYLRPLQFDKTLSYVTLNFAWQAALVLMEGHWTWTFRPIEDKKAGKALKISSVVPAQVGKLVHLAGVRSGDVLRFYVDGRKIAEKKIDGFEFPDHNSHFDMRFGKDMDKLSGCVFYEVRISNVARYTKNFTPAKRFEPDKDTLALYHFDEGQGDKLVDSSGNGHHGKIVGAKWVKVDGAAVAPSGDHALKFDGVSDTVTIPTLSRADAKGPMTIEAYVTPERMLGGPKNSQNIVHVGGPLRMQLYQRAMNWAHATTYLQRGEDSTSPPVAKVGERVHVAAVYDGTKARVYVNGRWKVYSNGHTKIRTVAPGTIIGGGNPQIAGDLPGFFAGIIDEVRISKTARYAGEFTPAKRFEPDKDTLALYHFDEGQGDKLVDSSGNGHHGKIVGAKWVKVDGTEIGPDRRAAEWVLSVGGKVEILVAGQTRFIEVLAELPAGSVQLHHINAAGIKLTDADVALHFANLLNLRLLGLHYTHVTDAGLEHLKSCSNLVKLNLNGTKITDSGIQHFQALQQLESLSLLNTAVTDVGLDSLKKLNKLRNLDLSQTKVTAAGVASLQKALPKCKMFWDGNPDPDRRAAEYVLKVGGRVQVNGDGRCRRNLTALPKEPFRLTYVDLFNQQGVTDAGLAVFERCDNVEILILRATPVTDAGLVHFRNCKNLKTLYFNAAAQISDAGLANFTDCEKLTELSLAGTKTTDKGLAHFRNCRQLKIVDLDHTLVTDAGLPFFYKCKDLASIDLTRTKVTAAGVAALQKALPKCKIESDFAVNAVSDFTIDRRAAEYIYSVGGKAWINGQERMTKSQAELPKQPFRLTGVSLAKKRDTSADVVLARIKDCKQIKKLGLWATSITDAGLAQFDGTDQITYLVLANTKVSDKGLAYFRNSKKIHFLKLSGTRITDRGLAHFENCDQLQELHLAATPVTKSGLAHFKDCKKLAGVYLDQTGLGDECVELIGNWKKLTFLDIRGTKFTAEGIARLQLLLPECQFGSSINAEKINKALKRIEQNR